MAGVEVDQPVEPQLEGIDGNVGVGLVGQHPAFDPPDRGGVPGLQAEGLARRHDRFPQGVALRAVLQVDFVAQFARPAGAGDDDRDAVELQLAQPVVAQVADLIAEQRGHDLPRLRPLQLQRGDVGLVDMDVEAAVHRHPLRPKQYVAVGQRQPEPVLGQPQQHGVVDQAAFGIGDQHVLALAHGELGQVARGQPLDEGGGVRAADLHLPLDGDIAQDGVVDQVPEVLRRVTEIARDVHVVVDGEPRRPPAYGGVEVGRFADLGAKAEVFGDGAGWRARAGSGVGHERGSCDRGERGLFACPATYRDWRGKQAVGGCFPVWLALRRRLRTGPL